MTDRQRQTEDSRDVTTVRDGADHQDADAENADAENADAVNADPASADPAPADSDGHGDTGGDARGDPSVATDGTDLDEALDLEALADSDPRSRAELLGELVTAEAKRDEYLDDLRRSHADFENYRRRVLREGASQREAGKADVAGRLLEVLDDLDRTLGAAEGSDDRDLARGVELVASKLATTLGQVGLERIDAVEVVFDPNVHEAVQQAPADEARDEPVVVQVLRPGYRLGERTLRAAMVVVEQ